MTMDRAASRARDFINPTVAGRHDASLDPNEVDSPVTAGARATPIRIVVVDDHPLVRDGLINLLDDEPEMAICGQAGDVASALEIAAATRPGVMIVDLALEHGSGLDIITQLGKTHPTIRMLVCSMYDESLYGERALQAGAHGYIQKCAAPSEIVDAVRRLAEGEWAISEPLLQRLARGAPRATRTRMPPLSKRERAVLDAIGQGKTVKEIAYEWALSAKTVETYRDRLRKKLGLGSSSRLVHYALQMQVHT